MSEKIIPNPGKSEKVRKELNRLKFEELDIQCTLKGIGIEKETL